MNEKPGHVRPANGFYEKLNALMFVPQQELSREQAYWLPANERASRTSNPNSPVTPFIHKSRPPSQVLASLQKVNAVFPIHLKISACDREHTKVLELEAEVLKQQKMVIESEKRNSHLQKNHIDLQLKFQNYKQCIDTSSASNAIFEINKLRKQLQGKEDTIRNLDAQANTHSRTAYTEKLSALTAKNTKLKAQVTGKTSSGSSTSEKNKVLASGMYTNSSKSKGRTVADSIAERLTRPTAYKFKTDCSIIPVWICVIHTYLDDKESFCFMFVKSDLIDMLKKEMCTNRVEYGENDMNHKRSLKTKASDIEEFSQPSLRFALNSIRHGVSAHSVDEAEYLCDQ
ncbi:hypothetical protein Tco_1312769 [Tanacetum coccineum]